MIDDITFKAHFARLTTLADGGIRISLDVSLSELHSVIKLPGLSGQTLLVAIIPEPAQPSGGPSRGPW